MKSLHRGGLAGNIKLNGKISHGLSCHCCAVFNFKPRERVNEMIDEIDTFGSDSGMKNYVKVMPDYNSTGIWTSLGHVMDLSELPISSQTKELLAIWSDEYDRNDDWKPVEERMSPLFDTKSYADEGFKIAMKIKEELPHYLVAYFNEHTLETINIEL